jgi:cytochrome c1
MISALVLYNRHPGVCLSAVALVVASAWLGTNAWRSQYQRAQVARVLTHGDMSRAPPIMRQYGCGGCHTIPGIPGADGQVGGSLNDIRKRVYIGGVVNNTADNLVQWIVSPQSFSPRSAMPATGISEAEARDVAAYLYAN